MKKSGISPGIYHNWRIGKFVYVCQTEKGPYAHEIPELEKESPKSYAIDEKTFENYQKIHNPKQLLIHPKTGQNKVFISALQEILNDFDGLGGEGILCFPKFRYDLYFEHPFDEWGKNPLSFTKLRKRPLSPLAGGGGVNDYRVKKYQKPLK